ncbi:MAG: PLP-dependent aminotransferase family protein [Mycobacterium sp.]|nr:PLP-dependent aminotransferase family protein [Mycobacterium sp.]
MASWANSAGRDLHLDLRHIVRPGAHGVRDLLITALRDAVRSRRLAPGTMLPPSRSLAADLGLARNTVAEAYAELVAEGWLASRQGSGTWVVDNGRQPLPVRPRGTAGAPAHNLMPGTPDVSAFPRGQWLASTRRALTAAPTAALGVGDPRGRPELREALAEYLSRARGVRTSAETVLICAGVRHGVELMARVFKGKRPLAVEAYGLFLFRDAIEALGIDTAPIRVDEKGVLVTDLDDIDTPAALITPAHQYPSGVPLHPSRRAALLEWARRTGAYVLEDDYDGEFRYDRQPIGALQGLDPNRVVYLGSTSKSLSPALRLGWMALPADLVDDVIAAAGGQQFYVNGIDQLTMADFLTRGQYDRHIRRMRLRYRRRRDVLVDALADFNIEISGLPAGLHLLLHPPDGMEAEVLRRAAESGVALAGMSRLRHPHTPRESPHRDGIVINFGAPTERAFARAVNALHRVLSASGLAG